MAVPLRHVRLSNDHDRMGSEPVLVMDENLAQHAFGRKDAVGKRIWIPAMGASPALVVGIVGHVRQWGLAADDQSRVRDQMYYPFAQVPAPVLHFFSSIMSFAARTTIPPLNVVESLRRELRGPAGDQTLNEGHTMKHHRNAPPAPQRFLLRLFRTFARFSLLLPCIPIYCISALFA